MSGFIRAARESLDKIGDGDWTPQDSVLALAVEKLAEAEAENERLRGGLSEALDIIVWMSGASDFGPEGEAREGWVKARDKLDRLLPLARCGLPLHDNCTAWGDEAKGGDMCEACEGRGFQSGAHTEQINDCPECDGTGRKKVGQEGAGVNADAMHGWRWLDGHAIRPGLYRGRRRIVPISVWLLRPRFMWRTREARKEQAG